MSVVLASLVLAAVLACPCVAMAAAGHGCCADEGSRIGPSDCCGPATSSAPWTPRVVASVLAAPPAAVAVAAPAGLPAPPRAFSAVALPASPPRVLRI